MSVSKAVPFSERTHPQTLVLFDVDGTLSLSRQQAQPEVLDLLAQLRTKCAIGFVGGSDLVKILEQLRVPGKPDQNGTEAYRQGELISSVSFVNTLGEDRYKELVRFCLKYISELDIPVMRGTFVECRKGMLNVSPIGRNASNKERLDFNEYDKHHKIRANLVTALRERFSHYGLTISIGGKISIDVFPNGWDKTYALGHVEAEGWKEIHFFGDETSPGGNDHEIYADPRTIGHNVTSPQDTMSQIKDLFFK